MRKAFVVIIVILMALSVAVAEETEPYIKVGDYNADVIELHRQLEKIGYLTTRPESPWNEKSVTALKGVQYVMGWDETGIVTDREQYEMLMNLDENDVRFSIKRVDAIDEYLEYLKQKRLTVFIAVRDEASNKLKASTQVLLKGLGLQTDWNGRYRLAYIAVIDDGSVVEEIAAEERTGPGLSTSGSVGGVDYSIDSSGWENDEGSKASIVLNDKECSRNRRGINIVVMDNGRVIDSVSFDTCGEEDAIANR